MVRVAEASTEQLRCGATELGVTLSACQVESLVAYAALLRRWNDKFNLVSRRDMPRLVSRHLLDSLSISPWLGAGPTLDFGSGAGLPGIPLAIAYPDHRFVLADRSARKARFLEQAAMQLELTNVTVRSGDATALEQPFASVVARGVAEPAELWRLVGRLVAPGGRLICMSRTAGDREGGTRVVNVPDAGSVRAEQVAVPGSAAPHEVILIEVAA
ncbi:MAG: 16S rRNA (guanine(527)-N(7))-methyltransferase RsmG [Pseudomonadales bacterium]|nr:16S rRNA (guanine(527)-N(7))-methyltransferase RsmG [Pseudomonadales bacterium]NIX07005.1 16S rRNA (guanine(527)-N(7))-methyltransferase RsmG [Pseudomonadales bacterium]